MTTKYGKTVRCGLALDVIEGVAEPAGLLMSDRGGSDPGFSKVLTHLAPRLGRMIVLAAGAFVSGCQGPAGQVQIVPQLAVSDLQPRAVAFTAANDLVVALNENGRVDVLDVSDPDSPVKLGERFADASALAVSPASAREDTIVATGHLHGTVRLWTLGGEPLGIVLEGLRARVNGVAFSADGNTLVAGAGLGTLRAWRREGRGWVDLPPLEGHGRGPVLDVALSPDGRRVVSVGQFDGVLFWERVDEGWKHVRLEGAPSWASSVAISPGGARIASAGSDREIIVWRRDGENWVEMPPLEGHRDSVSSLAFSPDGRRIVSGGLDGAVRAWRREEERWVGTPLIDGRQHGPVWDVAFSADGKRIVSGGTRGKLRLWRREEGGWTVDAAPLEGYRTRLSSVAFSENGERIVAGEDDGTVRVWEPDGEGWTETPLKGHRRWVRSVAFSADGERIVSGGADGDGTLRVWERGGEGWTGTPPLEGHRGAVLSVVFSSNGRRIVSGGQNGTVRVWERDGAVWTDSTPLEGHRGAVRSVALSADGERIVSGGQDGRVRVWDRAGEDWTESARLDGGGTVTLSADGERIVTGGENGLVRLWQRDGERWTGSDPFQPYLGSVTSVAFSSDDERIVVGGEGGTLTLTFPSLDPRRRSLESPRLYQRIGSCGTTRVRFVSNEERVAIACEDRWLDVDAVSGRVDRALFPTPEGLLSIFPGLGVWLPTERSRRFVQVVDGGLDVLPDSVLDDADRAAVEADAAGFSRRLQEDGRLGSLADR